MLLLADKVSFAVTGNKSIMFPRADFNSVSDQQ